MDEQAWRDYLGLCLRQVFEDVSAEDVAASWEHFRAEPGS